MKGRIKNFKEEKGYGFILGEDGYDYFCHISEIRSMDMPIANSIVEFEASSSERGRMAINVNVVQRFEQRPEFINLGNYRIKISKIKSYNISKGTEREYFIHGLYNDSTMYYLYIDMFDDTRHTIKSATLEGLNEACEILDKLLGTVNL